MTHTWGYNYCCSCHSQSSTSCSSFISAIHFSWTEDGHSHFWIQRAMSFIGDPHSISKQPCSRDGSHSSMPRADVGHSGSTHCHLKAAPASFRPATSCWALHFYYSSATLSSHRASGPIWSTNWRGRLICLAPAPPSHQIIIYIYCLCFLCISFFLVLKKSHYFGTIFGIACIAFLFHYTQMDSK